MQLSQHRAHMTHYCDATNVYSSTAEWDFSACQPQAGRRAPGFLKSLS